MPGKQGGGGGEGRQIPVRSDYPERRGETALPDCPPVKGRNIPARLPARLPTLSKCTSHLGFGLVLQRRIAEYVFLSFVFGCQRIIAVGSSRHVVSFKSVTKNALAVLARPAGWARLPAAAPGTPPRLTAAEGSGYSRPHRRRVPVGPNVALRHKPYLVVLLIADVIGCSRKSVSLLQQRRRECANQCTIGGNDLEQNQVQKRVQTHRQRVWPPYSE